MLQSDLPPPPRPYLRSQPSHLRRTWLNDPVARVLELLIIVWQVVVRVYDILVGGELLEVLAVLALQGCVMEICSVQVDGDEIGVGHDRQGGVVVDDLAVCDAVVGDVHNSLIL